MSEDSELFRNLLLWLWDNHQRPWDYSGQAWNIYEKIQGTYVSFTTREDLETLLPSSSRQEGDFIDRRKFLYLDPVVDATLMLPVLSARWDFGPSISELRLRLGLFLLDEAGALVSLGYRFEAPEGEGRHHYCHTQLIRAFDKTGAWPLDCPVWLPTTQPAFPLDAQDCTTLVVCLLTSLYGAIYLRKLQLSLRGVLDRAVAAMMFNKIPTSDYWEVRSKKVIGYYRTRHPQHRFQNTMRRDHGAQSFKRIERDEYYLKAPAKQRVL